MHRKRWNTEGLGLLLDLIDPFKFADREKLLEAVLSYSMNWRDFYTATDRHGVRFYYPKPDTINVLERIGEEADTLSVYHDGSQMTLVEAYRRVVTNLIEDSETDSKFSFTPFTYPQT